DRIKLPELSLAPGESKLFDTNNSRLKKVGLELAGLEIEYGGSVGDVIAAALSVSSDGDQVYPLLLKDAQAQPSSTGGYPFFIEDQYWFVIFLKNASNEPQSFILELYFPGGRWSAGMNTLQPGATYKLDVREARNSQRIDHQNRKIPMHVQKGHVSWSLVGKNS